MLHDNYQIRLRVIFILLWLLLAVFASFGQKYRVRAVQGLYYIQDTITQGDYFQVYSPFLNDIVLKLSDEDGTPVIILTSTKQRASTYKLQGVYNWEIYYKDGTETAKSEGKICILAKD